MAEYEYGRIKVLAGGESIRKGDKPVKKSDWMKQAMDRMDDLLDEQTRHSVRESCACCLGGKRLEISKSIAKSHTSLEDAIAAANEAKYVFGHSVTMEEDGRILVLFEPEGKESYRCVCLPKAKEPISETYCYCCGGRI